MSTTQTKHNILSALRVLFNNDTIEGVELPKDLQEARDAIDTKSVEGPVFASKKASSKNGGFANKVELDKRVEAMRAKVEDKKKEEDKGLERE